MNESESRGLGVRWGKIVVLHSLLQWQERNRFGIYFERVEEMS